MPDERGGSWPVSQDRIPAQRAMPNPLRRTTLPKRDLEEACGTPWRVAIRAVLPGGDGEPDELAAASGYTLMGDAAAALLSKEVPNDQILVVEYVIFRPVSELGYEYLAIALTDGGHANDTSPAQGRLGNVIRLDIALPVNGSGVCPVNYQCAGGTLVRLWADNSDPVSPHAVDAEMAGTLYPADQFRATAPRAQGR